MRILDPLADPHWDEKLLAHEDASIFHTAAWARVLRDSYGYSCCYLAETDGDRFHFLLPLMDVRSILTGRRGISLPFTDFCDPLIEGGVSASALINELVAMGRRRRWDYFEVRGGESLFGDQPAAATVLGHTLDLAHPEEALFGRMKECKRRNVRKARRQGVEVGFGSSKEMMESFYRLLCLTRREHGLPPQSLAFFRNIHECLLTTGLGCVALATVGGETIGGAIFLHFGRNAMFKYGASDRRHLLHRPNDLVLWEAIRWCRSRGFHQLSLGRTEREHEGLRRFKTGWGVEERQKPYYRYRFQEEGFGTSPVSKWEASLGIFRMLPIPVSRMIGRAFYRHVA